MSNSNDRYSKVISNINLANLHGVKPDMTPDQRRSFVVSTLQSSDPTPTGKYAGWLMRLWANGTLRIEDMGESARETLADFERVKKMGDKGLPSVDRSILRYKTMGELFKALLPFAEVEQEGSRDRKRLDAIKADMETYSFSYPSGLKVIIPLTRFSAQHHGRQTKWCTSADHNNAFEDYSQSRPVVIFELPDGQRFQGAMFDDEFVEEFSASFDVNDLINQLEFKNIYDNDPTESELNACRPYKDDIFQTLALALSERDREDILGSGIEVFFEIEEHEFGLGDEDENSENEEDREAIIESKMAKTHSSTRYLRDLIAATYPETLPMHDAIIGNDVSRVKKLLRSHRSDEVACAGDMAMIQAHLAYSRGEISDETARAIINTAPPRMVEKFVCGYGINTFLTDNKPFSKSVPALFKMVCESMDNHTHETLWPDNLMSMIIIGSVNNGEDGKDAKSVHAALARFNAMSEIVEMEKPYKVVHKTNVMRHPDAAIKVVVHEQLDILKKLLKLDLNAKDARCVARKLCTFVQSGVMSTHEAKPLPKVDGISLFGETISQQTLMEAVSVGANTPQAMRNLIKADPKISITNYDAYPEMRGIYRSLAGLYSAKDINKLSRNNLLDIVYHGLLNNSHSGKKFRRSMSAMPTPLNDIIPKAHMRLAYMSSCIPVYNADDASAFLNASKRRQGDSDVTESLSVKELTLIDERITMAIHDSEVMDNDVKVSEEGVRQKMNMLNPLFDDDFHRHTSNEMC